MFGELIEVNLEKVKNIVMYVVVMDFKYLLEEEVIVSDLEYEKEIVRK